MPWSSAGGASTGGGYELELQPQLLRVDSGVRAPPVHLWAHLQIEGGAGGERWSRWHTTALAPGEALLFDLGDWRQMRRFVSTWHATPTLTLHAAPASPSAAAHRPG